MNRTAHKIFISVLVIVIISVLIALVYMGYEYYSLSLENRFFHSKHSLIKPSGEFGHGYGVFGSAFILIGVFSYMARKRFRNLSRLGFLKHWLEFHIFLCVLGPILILFHTSFKFGGIVAISFWSMVAVVLSGVLGRFIYMQIPRSVEGRELSQGEISLMQQDFKGIISHNPELSSQLNTNLDAAFQSQAPILASTLVVRIIKRYLSDRKLRRKINLEIRKFNLSPKENKLVRRSFNKEISIRRKMDLLSSMQNLLQLWHIAHLPFALIMLIIMLIHVTIVIIFGYKWIL